MPTALLLLVLAGAPAQADKEVTAAEIDPLDPDASARAAIEAQDRKIAEMSGQSRGRIRSIARSIAR